MSAAIHFKFRLYVHGDGPIATQAIANLTAICHEYLPDRHEIELVDVLRDQKRALADGVMLTPLLMKLAPEPVRLILGSLSKLEPVLEALGLSSFAR
jgi:circadian clock protein KaiB